MDFGRAVARISMAAVTLAALTSGAAASPETLGPRLDTLLGSGRLGAAVGPAAAALPGPLERGMEVEIALEARIEAAEAEGDEEWRCLSEAIYHEARGETLEGQVAVAEVVLNRRDSGRYPDSVCGVVQQGTGEKWMCQFSYFCDGLSDEIADEDAWNLAGRIARVMLDGASRDLTRGAQFYHTRAVDPYWADQFTRTAAIGAHLFYVEEQVQMASNASD